MPLELTAQGGCFSNDLFRYQMKTALLSIRWKKSRMYQLKLATLIPFCCMSMTMLFAQTPSAPAHPDGSAAKLPAASAYANTKLTYKIIDAPKHTYGYNVFADGRLMIHQTSAPALPGKEGFKTKEDATKVALLVIEKIKKGEMPPTISIDEIKKLGVVK
jgi:Domain of unknown function (DUF4907)